MSSRLQRDTVCVGTHRCAHMCMGLCHGNQKEKSAFLLMEELPSSWHSCDAISSSWYFFCLEKSSNMNRFSVSTCMTCINSVSMCKFINKCKTRNSGKHLFKKKKRLRYILSPVVDKKETVPCDPLTGTFWRLSRKSHCSVEQLQRWEDWWRVEGNCNRDRQRKAENRTFYHVSCSMCFPGVYLMSSPITITTGISQCYASSLRDSFFN